MASHDPIRDVRMRGFASRTSVADAFTWLDGHTTTLEAEEVDLANAAGRVLASEIVSRIDVPPFPRGMMDGYAIRAEDSSGATPYNRLRLRVVGEVLPGHRYASEMGPGQAVRIMTGARLPDGADAVIPVEKTEISGETVTVSDSVSPGKHVGHIGEDVAQGQMVLSKGRRLRPQDLGVLSSIGVRQLTVVRRPRVRILVTGNELLPPGSAPRGEQIADANSPMLEAFIDRDGGVAVHPGILPDSEEAIREAFQENCDVVLVSGGSSVGQEDYAPRVLAEEGELAIHGISMRPSSPTGMGLLKSTIVILLPGNPVSCMCAYDFFAGRAIRRLGGRETSWPYPMVRRKLARKLVSVIGRVDYARVQLKDGLVEPIAISGASLLSSTTRADGFVVIPEGSEGFAAGSEVQVQCYSSQ
jgi:molybdopterin molybdotransferase